MFATSSLGRLGKVLAVIAIVTLSACRKKSVDDSTSIGPGDGAPAVVVNGKQPVTGNTTVVVATSATGESVVTLEAEGSNTAATPGQFSITAPAPTTADNTPTFSWSAAEGAAKYDLTVSTVANCATSVQTATNLTATSHTFETGFLDGSYYVCVTAKANSGATRQASNTGRALLIDSIALGTFDVTGPNATVSNLKPTITWSAADGAVTYQVILDSDSSCSTPVVVSQENVADVKYTLTQNLTDGATYYVCVIAKDDQGTETIAGNSPYTFTVDVLAPSRPTGWSSAPSSPSNSTSPLIRGSSEEGSTVRLYTNASCSGAAAASGSAAVFASPGLSVTVDANSTATFYGTATDSAGNSSPCSDTSYAFVSDSLAPSAATGWTTSPVSPSSDNSPEAIGTAEAGSTVRIYGDASCAGTLLGSGSAATFASPGITLSVAADSTTALYATVTDQAGNASACASTAVTYVEDSTAPSKPTGLITSPVSPANSDTPRVSGSADLSTTVRIYSNSNCTSAVLATGTAAAFSSPGLQINLISDTTTTLYATATDAAGNASACSTESVTYVEDSTAPGLVTGFASTPPSPANNNSPSITGTAASGSTVRLYSNSTCSSSVLATGSDATFASPGLPVTVADNSTVAIYATATDQAGNVSACSSTSLSYQEDSTQPSSISSWFSVPASPANNNNPVIKGTADANTTVRIYTTWDCSGSPVVTGDSDDFTTTGLAVTVADNSSVTFYGTTTTMANNTSPCSTESYSYVEDSAPPVAPTGLSVTPFSPANDNSPRIIGGAEPGSIVKLYTNASCTSAVLASGTAADFGSPGITIAVADNSTTIVYATATDAAGNASACSSSFVQFVEDSAAMSAPSSLASTPASPSSDNAPRIHGVADAGSTVKLYTNDSCTSAVLATGTAAQFTSPGITVSLNADTTTTIYATATDVANNISSCSSGYTYVEDSTAPAAPTLSATSVESPGSTTSPKVTGTAEAGSTVSLHLASDCSGGAIGTGSAAQLGGLGVTATVPSQAASTIYAKATDAAGNVSPCSSPGLAYTHREATLVKDIRTDSIDSSTPQNGLVMGSWAYFSASNGINGTELWRSDGTALNTEMIDDISSTGSSSPAGLTDFGDGTFLFTANDGELGVELWRTDGGPGNAYLVKDVQEGPYSGSPALLTKVGTKVFFRADDGVSGVELWVTDGTVDGTNLVLDINPGTASSTPSTFAALGSLLIFTATDPTNGTELWVSDGTAGGTTLLKDIRAGATNGGVGQPVVLGAKAFFAANDGTTGAELWETDGTAVGTVLTKDIRTGTGNSSPTSLARLGSKIYFSATNGTSTGQFGTELWETDGTAAGTVLTKDIRTGTGSSSPTTIVAANNALWFRADNNTGTGSELWTSDGTAAGTVFVKDIYPGTNSSTAAAFFEANGVVFFTATDGTTGVELFRTDGTSGGTYVLQDINPGVTASSPAGLLKLGSQLLFRANNPSTGVELWTSDGTSGGTTLLKDINSIGSSSPASVVALGSNLIFAASNGVDGVELWKSDGTTAGTTMILDINPGSAASSPANLTVMGSEVFFTATDGSTGVELWKTDGTPSGTVLVKDIDAAATSSSPATLVVVGGTLFFSATDITNGIELWKSDGTTAGTVMVKNIAAAGNSSPARLLNGGSVLYFRATNGTNGVELWSSDGTSGGTNMIKDIYAGSTSSSPDKLTMVGSTLFFYANDNSGAGIELHKSDGTTGGTSLVKDINAGTAASTVTNQLAFDGKLFFSATTASEGAELWVSDGTSGGTTLVKDIRANANSGAPASLFVFNGALYFRADNGTNGSELWKTDGTTGGTVMLSDIRPGGTSSSPGNFVDLDGTLHFTASDASYGNELRRLKTSNNSVTMIQDIYAGTFSSSPTVYLPLGGTLYFRANDGVTGSELWRY